MARFLLRAHRMMWPEHSPLRVWTRRSGENGMKQSGTVVRALARIGREPEHTIAVVMDPSGAEAADVGAFVQVAEELGAPRANFTVTTRYPSIAWLTTLVEAGYGDVGFRAGWEAARSEDPPPSVAESRRLVCPALHTSQSRGVVLSVCGEHGDHLVLSRRQVARLCCRDFRNCPYRKGANAHAKSET